MEMFALCSFQAQISRFKTWDINIVCSSLYISQAVKLHVVEPSRGFGVSFDLREYSEVETEAVVQWSASARS